MSQADGANGLAPAPGLGETDAEPLTWQELHLITAVARGPLCRCPGVWASTGGRTLGP